jgi:hypothetical protein
VIGRVAASCVAKLGLEKQIRYDPFVRDSANLRAMYDGRRFLFFFFLIFFISSFRLSSLFFLLLPLSSLYAVSIVGHRARALSPGALSATR